MSVADDLIIEDAEVMFRNFAGAEKMYNSEGDRNFCIMLDPFLAEQLRDKGWNVKTLKAREEGDEPRPYIEVSVNYSKGRPPRVVLLTNGGKKRVDLGADEVSVLDYADVKLWDIVINPYKWEVGEKTGIKAYLKHAFVTLNENELEMKYADIDAENQDPTKGLNLTASDNA